MRSLDLFSCLGCHAIGFQRAGIGTIALCESNPWRRDRLAEQFPGVPIHDDVRTYDPFATPQADIVIGGPPCQATSKAAAIHGKRTGESLWHYMAKASVNSGAQWVVVEQPPGHKAWETEVCASLSRLGFYVGRFEFGACDIGAPYLRRRVFLVACRSLPRLALAGAAFPSAIASVKRAADARGDWDPDKLASLPVDARSARQFDHGPRSAERRKWIEALGDSNPPHMAEVIGLVIQQAMNE
jgi:DNA (cytosine-5)-methyltransferase 1